MSFANHPLRERVVSEMHMRRMPPLHAPSLMVQVVRLVEPEDREKERGHILQMPGVATDQINDSHQHISGRRKDGSEFLWESHSEATTSTVILPRQQDNPFTVQPTDDDAIAWLSGFTGGTIRAVKTGIVKDEATAEQILGNIGFSEAELVSCRIDGVRIWTDFLIRPDNFGRLLIAAGDMAAADLGRLVQKIQELGNYRNLALIGLPLAQAEAPKVAEMEEQLVAIAGLMAKGEADPDLLDRLCDLSAKVAAIMAETAFRMSATAAYAQIAQDRLDSLDERDIEGFQTLEQFTDRRFLPATRTCMSFVARLEALSVRIERATSLLRTRVEMTLQAQNSNLLHSMDMSATRQLRLQHLVEGLSVVAISYYAIGFVSYIIKAVAPRLIISQDILIAISIIPVVGLVWLYLRRRIKKIEKSD